MGDDRDPSATSNQSVYGIGPTASTLRILGYAFTPYSFERTFSLTRRVKTKLTYTFCAVVECRVGLSTYF